MASRSTLQLIGALALVLLCSQGVGDLAPDPPTTGAPGREASVSPGARTSEVAAERDPLALHRAVLDALDGMRIDDALACFVTEGAEGPGALLVTVSGEPASPAAPLVDLERPAEAQARERGAARALLKVWAAEGVAATRSRVIAERFEPLTPELGYVVTRFERRMSTVANTTWVRAHRSVAIVRREPSGWRLLHWNVAADEGWRMQ